MILESQPCKVRIEWKDFSLRRVAYAFGEPQTRSPATHSTQI
jgi:DNA-binding transcriptional regulator WhiA